MRELYATLGNQLSHELYLLSVLYKAAFILRHLYRIISKGIGKIAILKVLYDVLKLGVNFDQGAYSLRSMATTTQRTIHCPTTARP